MSRRVTLPSTNRDGFPIPKVKVGSSPILRMDWSTALVTCMSTGAGSTMSTGLVNTTMSWSTIVPFSVAALTTASGASGGTNTVMISGGKL